MTHIDDFIDNVLLDDPSACGRQLADLVDELQSHVLRLMRGRKAPP